MSTVRRRGVRDGWGLVGLVVRYLAAVLGGWLAVVAYTFATGGGWSDTWKYLPITAFAVLFVLWVQRLTEPRGR